MSCRKLPCFQGLFCDQDTSVIKPSTDGDTTSVWKCKVASSHFQAFTAQKDPLVKRLIRQLRSSVKIKMFIIAVNAKEFLAIL